MLKKLISPISDSKPARITFYTFEIASAVYFIVMFVMAIVDAAAWGSAATFFVEFFDACWKTLILYGIGRIVDVLCSVFGGCECEECEEKEEPKTEEKPVKKTTKNLQQKSKS